MTLPGGYSGRIAHYDLTKKAVTNLPWVEEEVLPFIGGRGLAASLLYKLLPSGVDPRLKKFLHSVYHFNHCLVDLLLKFGRLCPD